MQSFHYPDLDLLYNDAQNGFEASDFDAVGERLYSLDEPPTLSIWDFGRSTSAFNLDGVREMAAPSKPVFEVRGREKGKTAIVATNPLTFGRARQYVSYSNPDTLPFPQQVFASLEEALVWLGLSVEDLRDAERVVFYQS